MRDATWELLEGDNRIHLSEMEENSFHAVVCDPPYGLTSIQKRFGATDSAECQEGTDGAFKRVSVGFMQSAWDGTGIERNPEFWKLVLCVMKPGALLCAFGGTRSVHRMTCAIEDAGFQIRDQILAWTYGGGFSKNHVWDAPTDKERAEALRKLNEEGKPGSMRQIEEDDRMITEGWSGWGKVGLKPAQEPIVVAMKPLSESSYAANVLRWGTGGMNLKATRVGNTRPVVEHNGIPRGDGHAVGRLESGSGTSTINEGRFPPNLLACHSPMCSPAGTVKTTGQPRSSIVPRTKAHVKMLNSSESYITDHKGEEIEGWCCHESCWVRRLDEMSDGASRFFPQFGYEEEDLIPSLYCPKPGTREKEYGLERLAVSKSTDATLRDGGRTKSERANIHPTLKPTKLMRWIARLVTPPGGTVLDPFAGSGSTGVAALQEGFSFVGIEADPVFAKIARERLRNRPRSLFELEAT